MRRTLLFFLFAARLSSGQEIAASNPTFEPQTVESGSVASSGDRFVTAWGRGNNSGVFFSITDLGGTLVRGPVAISLTGGHPAIASGANGNLVAWIDGNSVYTVILDKDSNVGIRKLLISRSTVNLASVLWNGSRFLVLIRTAPAGVIGFLVDANGETISGPLPISDWTAVASAADGGFLVFATVAVDQSHPEKGFTIQSKRIDSTGAISALTQIAPEVFTGGLPSLAAAGRALFWQHSGVLHRVVIDSNGAPISDSIVATDTPFELMKAIDTPAGTLLALFEFAPRWWLMLVGSDGKLIARRDVPFSSDVAAVGTRALLVAPNGGPLRGYFADATSTIQITGPINVGQMAANQLFPQVASNGKLALTTWIEPSTAQLFAARVDLIAGKHLDGRGIAIDSQVYTGAAPAVAGLGDGFVVAYLEVSSGVAHLKIRRVFANGALDSAPTLISNTSQPFAPRLASDGNEALLVWTENTYKVRGTRISRRGAVLDPAFLRISDGDSLPLQFAPDVGIDGDDYLVAWQAQRTSPIQIRITAVHVTRSGVVLDPPAQLPMSYSARVAGDTVAGTNGANVILDSLGRPPVDLGTRSFGDVEQFRGGILFVGPDPQGLWAAVVENQAIENRFTIVLATAASQPSLTRTPSGVAVTYLRGAGDEGYGGSMRAFVLPISEQRRRTAPSTH
jgi:hypothetical protein